MGQIANDIIDGTVCDICGSFFFDKNGNLYSHGYPVTCTPCWKSLSKADRKHHQEQEQDARTH